MSCAIRATACSSNATRTVATERGHARRANASGVVLHSAKAGFAPARATVIIAVVYALLLLFLSLIADATWAGGDGAHAVVVAQMRDPPATATGDLAARVAAFDGAASTTRAQLLAALPRDIARDASLEALPALNAWLITLPAGTAAIARAALSGSDLPVAYLSLPVGDATPGDAVPDTLPAIGLPHRPRPARRLTLGLIDLGADRAHPAIAAALGEMHFQPGTPGAGGDGRLLRSHGTAMAGIYAQLLAGTALRAGDVVQPWLRLPRAVTLSDTLVAHAGPETPAGRPALLRALNWMLMPAADRPRPDVINYSQGNGRLCRPGAACRPAPWHGVTRAIDRLVDEQGITIVKSAGNLGDGDNTMTVPGETFNGITVGNMHAFDWQSCAPGAARHSHKIYRTSSIAPAAPAPRLLDVVAPGVRIGTTGVNPAYCRTVCDERPGLPCSFCQRLGRFDAERKAYWKENSGTSPAAAVVGALALYLIDEGLRDPRAVKALLINSADTWTSDDASPPRVRGNGGGCDTDVAASRHAPYPFGAHYDRRYGWGYVNPARLAQERVNTLSDRTDRARCYAATLDAWDKITLVWHRHVRVCAGCDSEASSTLVRLRLGLLSAEDGRTIDRDVGQSPLDNVLQVSNGRGPTATPGTQRVILRIDAAAPEAYALASPQALTRLPSCPAP